MGKPLERIMKMGAAMLEAVRAFKPPSSDGKKFEIRLGESIHPSCTFPFRAMQALALTLSTLQANSSTIHLSCLHAAYWAIWCGHDRSNRLAYTLVQLLNVETRSLSMYSNVCSLYMLFPH
jgi:hypothetical protein